MEKLQFKKGQLIAYGSNGVCVVDEIKKMSLLPDMPAEMYYILHTVRDEASKVFVPVDNTGLVSRMRNIMNEEQVEHMLKTTDLEDITWNNDRRARSDEFHSIIVEGVSGRLLSMICCIHRRKEHLSDEGKNLPVTDSNALKTAEKLLEDEIACVMHMGENEVCEYIRKTIDSRENTYYTI